MEWLVFAILVPLMAVKMLWEVHRLQQMGEEVDGVELRVERLEESEAGMKVSAGLTRDIVEYLDDVAIDSRITAHEDKFHANQIKQFELQDQAQADERAKAAKAVRAELI